MLTSFITNEIVMILILSVGITALALELIVPSFGLIGIAGIYLIFESVLALKNFSNPLIYIVISVIIAGSITVLIAKTLLRNIDSNKLVLNKNLSNSRGNKDLQITEDLIGREGVVVKIMRPSGEVEIDGIIYMAISSGNYINRGEKVKVEKIRGGKLYCRKINL